jgi:cytidylate kinase
MLLIMKLIVIYGATAVGKLTTAKELAKKTGYPILHNHMTIDLVENFFSFQSKPFSNLLRKIRLDIVNELLTQKAPGLIWTTGFPNTKDTHAFYKKLDNSMRRNGGAVNYVKLVCDPKEQKKRVLNNERGKYNKTNTVNKLTKEMNNLDFSTLTPIDQTLVIDNTHLSAQNVVLKIIKFFSLEKV